MSKTTAPPPPYELPHQNQPGYGYDQQTGMSRGPYGPAGTQNQTTVIVNQPYPTMGIVVQPRPPDYTVASVLVCLCCFFPTGLAAIIFAVMATSQADAGQYEEAQRSSRTARHLVIASIIVGIVGYVLFVALYLSLFVYATHAY